MPDQGRCGLDEGGLVLCGLQAGEDLLRGLARGQQGVRGGLFEAGKQLGYRLVLLGDASDGHWARDDAHLVCGVALVLCLPQGVLAEPDLEVAIDGRHPRHRLDVLVMQGNPPCGVARGHACRRRLRVGRQQMRRRGRSVVDLVDGAKEGIDLAVVSAVETRLDAVEEVEEAVIPRGVHERVSQFDEALEPFGVGHFLDVAEVRLRRLVQRGDDFFAAGGVVLDAQRSDETGGSRKGVVQVVDVCQQVRLGGGHAVGTGTAADPTIIFGW